LCKPDFASTLNNGTTETIANDSFDEVWEAVNDNFFDPNFNGVDWQAMREKYQPRQTKPKAKQWLV